MEELRKRQEEEAEKEKKKKEMEELKKMESRRMGMAQIQMENELEKEGGNMAEKENLPDDSDDVNLEEEYEAWKIRELRRIKREREQRAE